MLNRLLRLVAVTSIIAIVSGCATAGRSRPVQPTARIVDIPKPGEPRTIELGETTVEKGRVFTYDVIDLKNPVSGGDGVMIKKFTIPPGVLRASSENENYRIFTTDQATVYDALIGTLRTSAGLAVSKREQTNVQVFAHGRLLKPSEPPQINATTVNAIDQPSFKQEFIYNGRAGDSVKFLYRELSGDLMRPAFNQELQYDLREGTQLGSRD